MNEPTVEEIAMMATRIFASGQVGLKRAVRVSIDIWDQAIMQLEERRTRKEGVNEMLDLRKGD